MSRLSVFPPLYCTVHFIVCFCFVSAVMLVMHHQWKNQAGNKIPWFHAMRKLMGKDFCFNSRVKREETASYHRILQVCCVKYVQLCNWKVFSYNSAWNCTGNVFAIMLKANISTSLRLAVVLWFMQNTKPLSLITQTYSRLHILHHQSSVLSSNLFYLHFCSCTVSVYHFILSMRFSFITTTRLKDQWKM